MPRFRFKGDQSVSLFRPRGHEAMLVEPGDPIEVPGQLVTSRPEPKDGEEVVPLPDDAYIVENHGEEKAWPHSLWELVDKAPAKPVKEN